MNHTRKNSGVCSTSTTVQLAADGTIEKLQVANGCDGNLQGVCRLLEGRNAAEAAELLRGIRCEESQTSCPAQIALCLDEALALQQKQKG